jgi:riboflavin kinase/FMN adenylyltransferase
VEVITDTNARPDLPNGSVVTIGAYDGLHRGHREVIEIVRRKSTELGARSAVVTFDRHPASVVRPESAPRLLTDSEQKVELLATTGIDITVMVPFTAGRAGESAEAFIEEVLVGCLRARAVVVGVDFHFGHNRRGNVAMLREMGERYGFEVLPVDLVGRADGVHEPISSTAIRRALAGGEVDVAARLLGRPLEVRGEVVRGDQRGRQLGFPTANVLVPDFVCLPADGVYAGFYETPDGESYPCAINLGRRPTFYEHADHSLLEAHLLDFEGDLYGQRAKVRFVEFLRSERKFDGVDALIAQLKQDIDSARLVAGGSRDASGPGGH